MRNKSHIWIPALMTIYLIFMALRYKDELLAAHRYFQFYGTIGIEVVIIVALYFFLRKRNKLRAEREEDMKRPR